MVLLYNIDNNITIYRKVIRNNTLQEHIEGFLALRHYNRTGKLYQLKGNERILLRKW